MTLRARLRLLSIVALAFALTGLYWVPKPVTAVPSGAAAHRAVANVDVAPLGANFFLEREVEDWKRELTISMARDAGIRWIRQMFSWEEIEPRKGDFFDDKFRKSTWEKYDAIVDHAERYGMRIIARLERPPPWTRRDNTYAGAPPDDLRDYFDFVKTVVSRYKGRVQHYQFWTEPNIWPEWGSRGVDPEGYVEMLRGAYAAARAIDPNVLVLSAPLAQTLEESNRNLNELKYLDAMYRAGAKSYFDILSANAYGFEAPPNAAPDPGALNFGRLLLLRQVMEQYGDEDKAVWFNEFGWNAAPAAFPLDRLTWRRVTEQQQAEYTAEAVRLARSWGWVGVLNYWYFRHAGDIPVERADYFFRMVDVDFTPRPVYHHVKRLGLDLAVAKAGSHGQMDPALRTQGRWRGQTEPTASGRRLLIAPPGGVVSITFDGTGLNVQVKPGPSPATLHAIVDGPEGQTFTMAIPPDGHAGIPTLTVVRGLYPGPHTVDLVSDTGGWGLDGFEVENNPNTVPFWALVVLVATALAGLAASSVVRWGPR